jgi:DNA-directed RNA polymerase subunit beta
LLSKLTTLLANHTSAGVSNNFGEVLIGKGPIHCENLTGLDYQNINPLGGPVTRK